MNKHQKSALMIYADTAEAISMLSDCDCGVLFKAIAGYSFYGISPSFNNANLSIAWSFIKPRLDVDQHKYDEAIWKKKYAPYVRECKKNGVASLSFDDWKTSLDINDDHRYQTISMISNLNNDIPIPNTNTQIPYTDTLTPNTNTFTDNQHKGKNSRFIKPSLEEIKSYCSERGNSVSPEQFFDYYESCGWKIGNKPMKEWKASIRYWERNEAKYSCKSDIRKIKSQSDYRKGAEECF